MCIDKARYYQFAAIVAHANGVRNLMLSVFPFAKPFHFSLFNE
ncbi:Uncharacterised protein [Klebsiella pneumoniae]|nr:Uncharacterised protein [Klebsiella pneumoniae]